MFSTILVYLSLATPVALLLYGVYRFFKWLYVPLPHGIDIATGYSTPTWKSYETTIYSPVAEKKKLKKDPPAPLKSLRTRLYDSETALANRVARVVWHHYIKHLRFDDARAKLGATEWILMNQVATGNKIADEILRKVICACLVLDTNRRLAQARRKINYPNRYMNEPRLVVYESLTFEDVRNVTNAALERWEAVMILTTLPYLDIPPDSSQEGSKTA